MPAAGACDEGAGLARASLAVSLPLAAHMRDLRDDSFGAALGRAASTDREKPTAAVGQHDT